MKTVSIMIEDKGKLEINVKEKDIESLLNIIYIFDNDKSGKIKA